MVWKRIFGRPAQSRSSKPRTAPGARVYAVGDVHGRADLLTRTFAKIDADADRHPDKRCQTVLVGDYVDRGPDSSRVIDLLIAREQVQETIPLIGNHEVMMLQFLDSSDLWDAWAPLGGVQTLLSYGLRPSQRMSAAQSAELAKAFAAALPPRHRAFLARLPYTFESGDYLFVHAGLRPGVPLAKQEFEDLIWIRDEFLNFKGRFEKVVVHGHTPAEKPELLPNRINIDTGAFATGHLTCLVLDDDKVNFL